VIKDIGVLPTSGGATPGAGQAPPDPADPPVVLPTEPGDTTVTLAPTAPTIDGTVTVGGEKVPRLEVCVILPKPLACPGGIIGRYGNKIPIRPGSLFPTIDVKFVDSTKPNVVLVGFTISTGATANVEFWRSDGAGGVRTAGSMSSLSLPGSQPVVVARLATDPATEYRFQVVASGIFVARSPVGTFKTGAGLRTLDIGLAPIDRPVIGLDDDSPVYTRIKLGEFAKPVLPCTDGAIGDKVLIGGNSFCMPRFDAPAPASCAGVKVRYDIVGMTGDQVAVRASPTVGARLADGAPAEETVIEVFGPNGSSEVTVGCLTPGITYQVAIDIVGDPLGPIATREVSVPGS
jgi:hypothetical protein